jgi:hypothetical protein
MAPAHTAFCGGCLCEQPVDRRWRAFWVDSDGDLCSSRLEKDGDMNYERPGTVLVCGDGSALSVVERYLRDRSLDSTLNLIPAHFSQESFAELT